MRNLYNGRTATFGLLGNPVKHTLSPLIHNTLFQMAGINGVYVPFLVDGVNSLEAAVLGAHALGIRGLNVTVPYKKDVLPFLADIDETAEEIGAVNTLVYGENGYKGYNTDVLGLINVFDENNIDFSNQTAVILGAGGGAHAAAFAAVRKAARKIVIANRTINNAKTLASRVKTYYNVIVDVVNYDEIASMSEQCFVLQTTKVGLDDDESPVDMLSLKNATVVMDLIYSPPKTRLLRDAESMGKTAVNGLMMLVYQAVSAFERWNVITVSKEDIRKVASMLLVETEGING